MQNVNLRIYRIIRELGGEKETIQPRARLKEDIGFDSFDLCCFLNSVEYRCNVIFNKTETRKFKTVGNIVDYVSLISN